MYFAIVKHVSAAPCGIARCMAGGKRRLMNKEHTMSKCIAVIAANGKSGRAIVGEAVDRGIDVTAVVRGENRTSAQHVLSKDLFDLTADDLAGFDAVVDAFGTWAPDSLQQHSASLQHLADILSGTDVRLLVVGGAGSLYLDQTHTLQLSQSGGFPEAFKPLATAMGESLAELRKRNDVKWTYVSPAADFRADGPRTGKYVLAGEEFTTNTDGESAVSYADYAIAIVDELLAAPADAHVGERISVRW